MAGVLDAAEAKRLKPSDSSIGSAMKAELERRKCRRFFIIIKFPLVFINFEVWIEIWSVESERERIRERDSRFLLHERPFVLLVHGH